MDRLGILSRLTQFLGSIEVQAGGTRVSARGLGIVVLLVLIALLAVINN